MSIGRSRNGFIVVVRVPVRESGREHCRQTCSCQGLCGGRHLTGQRRARGNPLAGRFGSLGVEQNTGDWTMRMLARDVAFVGSRGWMRRTTRGAPAAVDRGGRGPDGGAVHGGGGGGDVRGVSRHLLRMEEGAVGKWGKGAGSSKQRPRTHRGRRRTPRRVLELRRSCARLSNGSASVPCRWMAAPSSWSSSRKGAGRSGCRCWCGRRAPHRSTASWSGPTAPRASSTITTAAGLTVRSA